MTPVQNDLKPARAVEALLGRGFPGHTMQRVRTPDGRYRYGYVGEGVKDLFGLDPDELMQRDSVDHAWIHPEDRGRFVAALERSAEQLTPLDEEVRVARPEGGYRWVRSIGHPRPQADGAVIWDGVALDVHDRVEALDSLADILTHVRDSEAAEGRLTVIAAQDATDRLSDLRRAILAARADPDLAATPAMRAVFDRFDALDRALAAAGDMVGVGAEPLASRPATVPALPALTGRQREILELVADGASNREIGARLSLSEGTVKQHLSAIYKRLGVANRTEAARQLR